jgi:2-keto-myo-inositol isomerase
MHTHLSRRDWLLGTASLGAGLAAGARAVAEEEKAPVKPFRYSLNTSTIRGQKLTLPEEVDLAARAGYDAIEPWVSEITEYVRQGGALRNLAKRIRNAGLTVESSIGFFAWIVDDVMMRQKGLEDARRSMDLVQQIGGKRIAAPPVGATRGAKIELSRIAERYRALLELGGKMGVVPQVEVWGFSTNLGQLGEVACVAVESGHPKACILADVYHLYKGGSPFIGLGLLNGAAMHAFHLNDYPSEPPRDKITDADRVYPGDGVAPLGEILRTLHRTGFRGALSLELFNRDYWKQDAAVVARTGLEKMKAVVKASGV